jgi:uridine kinase
LRLARRIERDIRERGRTTEQILAQYFATVRPMHEQWVEPSKRYADLIVPTNDHSINVAVQALGYFLRVKSGILSHSETS